MGTFMHKDEVIHVEWLDKRSGNFRAGKVYRAEARFRQVGGKRLWSGFEIKDEDGDYFGLVVKDENRKWRVVL